MAATVLVGLATAQAVVVVVGGVETAGVDLLVNRLYFSLAVLVLATTCWALLCCSSRLLASLFAVVECRIGRWSRSAEIRLATNPCSFRDVVMVLCRRRRLRLGHQVGPSSSLVKSRGRQTAQGRCDAMRCGLVWFRRVGECRVRRRVVWEEPVNRFFAGRRCVLSLSPSCLKAGDYVMTTTMNRARHDYTNDRRETTTDRPTMVDNWNRLCGKTERENVGCADWGGGGADEFVLYGVWNE
jgi:hypothetical protein